MLDRNYVEDPIFKGLSDKFGKKGMKIMRTLKLKGNDTSILNGYFVCPQAGLSAHRQG